MFKRLAKSIYPRNYRYGSNSNPNHNLTSSNKFGNTLRQLEDSVVVKDMQDLLVEMRKRKYNLWWLMVPIGGVLGFLGFGGYSLLKERTTKEVTGFSVDVIEKLLEDDNTKILVNKFCHETIKNLLNSKELQNEVAKLLGHTVNELTKEQYIKDHLSDLFYHVFLTDTVRRGGSDLSSNVVQNIIKSNDYEWLRQEIYQYISHEIQKVTNDREIQTQLNQVAWKTVTSLIGINPSQEKKNIDIDVPLN